METFTILHPSSLSDFSQIQDLLQTELRSGFESPYSIEQEYPLVLGDSNKNQSFVVKLEDQIIAHANFLLRKILDHKSGKKYSIALVGNVCTHSKYQSQGWIRKLLGHLEKEAEKLDCLGIWLWSDKKEIYHKLGFSDQGRELRIQVSKKSFLKNPLTEQTPNFKLKLANVEQLKSHDYAKLQKIRPKIRFELERSKEEYRKLLMIPDTQLFLLQDKQDDIKSFIIIGRGVDFRGVAHEWGSENTSFLSLLLVKLFEEWKLETLLLLAPKDIQYSDYFSIFKTSSTNTEEHPCALFKATTKISSENPKFINEIFIWGMDSI